VAVSDHFQGWRHDGGHAPNVLPWLGALVTASTDVVVGTSVLTPTLRYHPSVVAQAFATLGCLAPGRVWLGVGTGESLNETPATAAEFPGIKERRMRLAEAVRLIRRLWTEERVDFDGEFYRTSKATIYDLPEQPIPIHIAAGGPLAAKLAGRAGDGMIVTSGKGEELYTTLLGAMAEGAEAAGRDAEQIDRIIEIKVAYDRDIDVARESCKPWSALALTGEEKAGIDDPLKMQQAAEGAADRAHTRFIVADDPQAVVEGVRPYAELGFRQLIFHLPSDDQSAQLNAFTTDVLPALRATFT
jgi:coenzyme F420-dependent glucose-6-phosphate dehydrogenase